MNYFQISVLLIESDPFHQMAFSKAVVHLHFPYELEITNTLSKAKHLLEHKKFDIIISGMELNGGSIFDILEIKKETPVIILTAPGDEKIAAKAIEMGACNYLIKDSSCSYLNILPAILAKSIELRRVTETALAADKIKRQFLCNINHEIRTPINGILGMLQLMKLSDLNNEQKEYLDIACCSALSLLKTVNSILDFNKFDSNQMVFRETEFDLEVLTKRVIDAYLPRAENKGLDICFYIFDNVPKNIIGDDDLLAKILECLLDNAVKFTEQGRINLSIKAVQAYASSAQLVFSIHDTGVGIPLEKTHEIYDIFNQGDNSLTRKHGGIGLGLSIVKKIVEMLGGLISFSSKEGFGTIFEVSLKYKLAPQNLSLSRIYT